MNKIEIMKSKEASVREYLGIVANCISKKNYIMENLEMYGMNTTLQEIVDSLDEQKEKYNNLVSDIFYPWESHLVKKSEGMTLDSKQSCVS